jgi:hypothetical protein
LRRRGREVINPNHYSSYFLSEYLMIEKENQHNEMKELKEGSFFKAEVQQDTRRIDVQNLSDSKSSSKMARKDFEHILFEEPVRQKIEELGELLMGINSSLCIRYIKSMGLIGAIVIHLYYIMIYCAFYRILLYRRTS